MMKRDRLFEGISGKNRQAVFPTLFAGECYFTVTVLALLQALQYFALPTVL